MAHFAKSEIERNGHDLKCICVLIFLARRDTIHFENWKTVGFFLHNCSNEPLVQLCTGITCVTSGAVCLRNWGSRRLPQFWKWFRCAIAQKNTSAIAKWSVQTNMCLTPVFLSKNWGTLHCRQIHVFADLKTSAFQDSYGVMCGHPIFLTNSEVMYKNRLCKHCSSCFHLLRNPHH